MVDLADYEDGICSQCGWHMDLHDPANVFKPKVDTCTIAAGLEVAQRQLAEADDQAEKRIEHVPDAVKATIQRPGDGRRLSVELFLAANKTE